MISKKQLLEQVLNNKLYKKLSKKLSEDQRVIIEKRLETIAGNYSEQILEKFSKIIQNEESKKTFDEIFNKQQVISEKTGKPLDKK